MFYFLLILGGGCILLGLKKRKKERSPNIIQLVGTGAVEQDKPVDSSELSELNKRIDQLQKLVFESLLIKEEKKTVENKVVFEEKALSFDEVSAEPVQFEKLAAVIVHQEDILPEVKPIPENIKAMLEYERKGLSVQEIAYQTHMNKGEVLLLQNLAKHYAK